MDDTQQKQEIVIPRKTINRIISDVSGIIKNPLTANNIYYEHDEDNILKGYAMIVGPEDTPYYGGYYFFKFNFPNNYPHSPPKVTYYTNDGRTRFNPNLYKCGKVCLSVLNTWRGEGWTGCQTISSILLTICSILNEEPLLNEPGIKKDHVDFDNYNDIIQFKNYEIALINMLTKDYLHKMFYKFYDQMVAIFLQNYDKYVQHIFKIIEKMSEDSQESNSEDPMTKIVATSVYSMTARINYHEILEDINILHQELVK